MPAPLSLAAPTPGGQGPLDPGHSLQVLFFFTFFHFIRGAGLFQTASLLTPIKEAQRDALVRRPYTFDAGGSLRSRSTFPCAIFSRSTSLTGIASRKARPGPFSENG